MENESNSGQVERIVGLPTLRLRLCFDLDLNSLLSKFKRNSAQGVPIKVNCFVETLSK